MNSITHKLRRLMNPGAVKYKLAPSDLSQARRKYAYKPDSKDPRDKVVGELLAKPAEELKLPPTFTLEKFLGPVKDQGELGSCTGNAYAGIREFLAKKYEKQDVILSALYIYYREREMEGTISEDAGAEPRDGCRALVKFGVCDEQHDPYLIQNFTQPPTEQMDEDASEFKVGAYHRARSVDEIKSGIVSGYCPSIGFDVFQSFEDEATAQTGELKFPVSPDEQPIGGHEVLAFGYDDNHSCSDGSSGAFQIRNSWGPGWGLNGNFWMPYNYVDAYVSDIWFAHLGKPWKPSGKITFKRKN
jgi:C1A family cysteine protease